MITSEKEAKEPVPDKPAEKLFAMTPEKKAVFVKIAAFSVFLLALAWPILREYIVECWSISDYSHCLLVPFVSIYLAIRRAPQDDKVSNGASWPGITVLIACLLIYLFSVITAFAFLARMSFFTVVAATVWAVLGSRRARNYAFPLLFLVFAVPPPTSLYDQMTIPMKLFATKISCWMLDMGGMAVVREGNIIHLRSGSLEVADACSGMRSLMTLLTLGAIIGYLSPLPLFRGLLTFVCAIPLAILLNIGRILAATLIAASFGHQAIEGTPHEISGYIALGVGLLGLVGVASLLELSLERKGRVAAAEAPS